MGLANRQATTILTPFLIAAAFLVLLWSIGHAYFADFALDFGSITLPAPRYTYFLLFYVVFGTAAAAFLALGLARLGSHLQVEAHLEEIGKTTDRQVIFLLSLLGLLIPLIIRAMVLQGAPITDDESCYQFMAELLARGHLTAQSPDLKIFYDREFMINNGHLYSQYFMGWPALMVPGVWLGTSEFMAAVYSALTIPALFLVLRRITGRNWAILGCVLFLCSPMLMIVAATKMAHTACVFALMWAVWFSQRAADDDAPWWSHAGVALAFSVAFFIRPTSALGVFLPFLVVWAWRTVRQSSRSRLVALGAFAIPSFVVGGLFLWVNWQQNGSPFTVSYQELLHYTRDNGFRFSMWTDSATGTTTEFGFDQPIALLIGNLGSVLLRFGFALSGWPISVLVLFFAWLDRGHGVLWASILAYLGVHFFVPNGGIDLFGPAKAVELSVPVLLLSVIGFRKLFLMLLDLEARLETSEHVLRMLPVAFVIALIAISALSYSRYRLATLSRAAEKINAPLEFIEENGIRNAVIFAPRPWTPRGCTVPANHFVFWRPNNDPWLKNEVLWVNHISLRHDRALMERFPERDGYVMFWDASCEIQAFPIEQAPPDFPDGFVGGESPVPEPSELR
ncbi:MAG: hypothetical protein AUK47_18060 [Deltaproteobacteria bacterium CG2_30_63_29]|nr:MAG: hypothetical protein AUK47_18060 [Deltaproteobacteria bacterium CG2_30_63_29]